eukprot:365387-Chlamydomonas_euryale.AAC.22
MVAWLDGCVAAHLPLPTLENVWGAIHLHVSQLMHVSSTQYGPSTLPSRSLARRFCCRTPAAVALGESELVAKGDDVAIGGGATRTMRVQAPVGAELRTCRVVARRGCTAPARAGSNACDENAMLARTWEGTGL